ncbi:phage terminase large subunit domain protein, partial [Escherichia coli 88.0221]
MRLHKIFSGRIRGLKKQTVSGFMLNKIPAPPPP